MFRRIVVSFMVIFSAIGYSCPIASVKNIESLQTKDTKKITTNTNKSANQPDEISSNPFSFFPTKTIFQPIVLNIQTSDKQQDKSNNPFLDTASTYANIINPIVTIIFILVTGRIAYKQGGVNKKQLRAYLGVVETTFDGIGNVTIRFKNGGNTPSSKTRHHFAYVPHGDTLDNKAEIISVSRSKNFEPFSSIPAMIFSGNEYAAVYNIACYITASEITKITIAGVIDYEDIFGKKWDTVFTLLGRKRQHDAMWVFDFIEPSYST